ncbi:DUF3040 domain-containing protein [Canibacter oris]|uniref:DUF3040 domain-containing protein n=1 Tax=Canibacter oris TaxID=1365628 RepID=A0A840DQ31_9MICO|nr:DUF3040 domain-containing protein [Canibacter oris]MBB4071306.1 hypothetical protein [Canibacter oris]
MALSDEERRLLAEMERNFYASEADLVNTSAPVRRLSKRNIVLGVVACVLGVALLLAGVVTQFAVLGVVGFVVMVAALVYATTPVIQEAAAAVSGGTPHPAGTARAKQTLTEKLEQRWQERQDGTR